ncbi:hypothetical protein H2198_009322 [Neophaeococcomyces mojaviensis]|uniref:Uncharacterized protein n=1 Tax=Neophaeococcomyces mojaviensis TaxID=3383035 RepID=A0ACC2ZUT7_9EURO|nr:hypothetical protein H2198_009322 [Knufia sp. JES_112]
MTNSIDHDNFRKRKAGLAYKEFEIAKRQQRDGTSAGSSMFLSDDEEPTAVEEELLAGDPNHTYYGATNESSPRRGQGTTRANGVNSVTNVNGTRSHASGAHSSAKTAVGVKEEQSDEPDWVKAKTPAGRVKIYVGRRNKQVLVKRDDLANSAILTSFITDDQEQGAYIMRPQLLQTDFNDFDAVLQYIHSGEYAPMLIEDSEDPTGPKLLDGLKTHEAYARELVRSGRIYVIAQNFQVEGLAGQVLKKITEVDITKFNNHSLIELAGVVFNDTRHLRSLTNTTMNGDGEATATAVNANDPLEQWIIRQLAKNFREIMRSEQATFWKIEHKTSKKLLFARVLEEAADQYRAVGGLPAVNLIELE